jgi:hypothetical protein
MKSWTLTRSGLPFGRHSRPSFLKFPTSSFFLQSTEMTGCLFRWKPSAQSLMYRNCASRAGWLWPSWALRLLWSVYPASRSTTATVP